MTQTLPAAISAAAIVGQMKKNGVTHVCWLPGSETIDLYTLMKAEPTIRLVPVSREGTAFSTAAGLAVGGKVPAILIQNTGLLESGDSIRGWGVAMNTPVVIMVGYRGFTRNGPHRDPRAALTEPFLRTFGINYYLVEYEFDADRITTAFEEAKRTRRPVAVLIGDEHGAIG